MAACRPPWSPTGLRRRALIGSAAFGLLGARAAEPPGPAADRAAQTLERWRALSASAPAPRPDPAAAAERGALLARGESRLAAGDAEAALLDFDLAAQKAHAADTEMSLVRAWMQLGEYRRAVAFVAHTAQAHRQAAGGAVLYGWLLSRGAQDAAALRMLDEAVALDAGSPLLAQVRELIARASALPEGELLAPPLRLAPYATGPLPPRGARVVGSAVLLADGRHALTTALALRGARGLWLRNGLGQTVAVKSRLGAAGEVPADLVALELAQPLPPDAATAGVAPRDPFPGSPGSVLVHQPDAHGRPAWPRLHAGFHGMPDEGGTGLRCLGIDVPDAARPSRLLHGGPIFDAAGRWAGLALPGADGVPRAALRSVLARRWPGLIDADVATGAASAPGARASLDEVYERALRSCLQLIVLA